MSRLLVSLMLLGLPLGVVRAQSVPSLINYQGKLSDATGNPLPTADYVLKFSLFDVASGGTALWGPQVFDGTAGAGKGPKIPVVQGYFNVILGPVDTTNRSLLDTFGGSTRFLQVTIGTGSPIMPRQQILSAPYAMVAETVRGSVNASGYVTTTGNGVRIIGTSPRVEGQVQSVGQTFMIGSSLINGSTLDVIAGSTGVPQSIAFHTPGKSNALTIDSSTGAVTVGSSGGNVVKRPCRVRSGSAATEVVTATCVAGEIATGGGVLCLSGQVVLPAYQSLPSQVDGNGEAHAWEGRCHSDSGFAFPNIVQVICCSY